MFSCKYSNNHKYILVEQRIYCKVPGVYLYICKNCGHEKILEDTSVIDKFHKHYYKNYCGCMNGFYILRCAYNGCDSYLKIFNPESQTCTNKGKRHLEDE